MRERITPPWALILAVGEGTRTRRRVDLLARFDHQIVVVTGAHEPFFASPVRTGA